MHQMALLLVSLLLLATAPIARAAGLVDDPISGASVAFLDSETWTADAPGVGVIRATVPGDLITDLQTAGLIGDPLYELNWLNSSIWDAHVWTFRRSFALSPLPPGGDVLLTFDGVKMSSTISINGVTVGKTTNQFLRYSFSLADAVARGVVLRAVNDLAVAFDSADQTTEGRWMACTGGWVRDQAQ